MFWADLNTNDMTQISETMPRFAMIYTEYKHPAG